MSHTMKNLAALLAVAAMTVLAIYGTVVATASLAGVDASSAGQAYATYGGPTGTDSSGSSLTCPRTGCTASYCHAAQGSDGGQTNGDAYQGTYDGNGMTRYGPGGSDAARNWQ